MIGDTPTTVFALTASLWTDTCLQSGETGWLLNIEGDPSEPDPFDPLDAIEFQYDMVEASGLSAARVIPDGYVVSATASATVCFANLGTGPAALTAQAFSEFVILDDAGAPLDWHFLTGHIEPLGLLAPGSAGSVSGTSREHNAEDCFMRAGRKRRDARKWDHRGGGRS